MSGVSIRSEHDQRAGADERHDRQRRRRRCKAEVSPVLAGRSEAPQSGLRSVPRQLRQAKWPKAVAEWPGAHRGRRRCCSRGPTHGSRPGCQRCCCLPQTGPHRWGHLRPQEQTGDKDGSRRIVRKLVCVGTHTQVCYGQAPLCRAKALKVCGAAVQHCGSAAAARCSRGAVQCGVDKVPNRKTVQPRYRAVRRCNSAKQEGGAACSASSLQAAVRQEKHCYKGTLASCRAANSKRATCGSALWHCGRPVLPQGRQTLAPFTPRRTPLAVSKQTPPSHGIWPAPPQSARGSA